MTMTDSMASYVCLTSLLVVGEKDAKHIFA